jgi:hypothetical protein
MAFLGKGDSTKPAKSGSYAGQSRLSCIKLKIKDGKPFNLDKAGKGDNVYGLKVLKETWPYEISYTETKKGKKQDGIIKATQIFKDNDLGGGGGSGGGSSGTTVAESLQCYYVAMLYNSKLKKLTLENTSVNSKGKSSLYDYEKYCDTDASLKECLQSDGWGPEPYIKIANALYNSEAGKKFHGKKVYVHRGSKFMAAVYAKKKRCLNHDKRMAKENGIEPVAPASFSNDKWNPGDIWMTTQTDTIPFPHNLNEGFLGSHTCDWGELKDIVRESADMGITLGISLKKVSSNASVKEYNTEKRSQNKKLLWKGFTFGGKGDFFSSADMYVYMNSDKVQFRSTQTTTSWQGEIKGGQASGGKIGGGGVQYYCEKHFKSVIGSGAGGHAWKETLKINDSDAWKLYKKFNDKQIIKFKTLDKQSFLKEWKTADDGLKFSKGMNLLFLDAVYNGNSLPAAKTLTKFTTDVFRYASSNTDYSSYFIKIS